MTYASLMVHLELGRSNAGLLQTTRDLAARFDAGVVGIVARQPLQMVYGDGYVSGDLYEQDRLDLARAVDVAKTEFHAALQSHVRHCEWRASVGFADLADDIAAQARCADLFITGVPTGDAFDSSRAVHVGDLIMRVGRPVLTVPAAATRFKLDQVLIGWKDTRETRRAVTDALPLLRQAATIGVVEIAAEDQWDAAQRRVADVVRWLRYHRIEATGLAQRSTGDDANALYTLGQDRGVDLFVAGAYGHSRLREWVLGGVTRDLLLGASRCALLSH